MPVTLNPFTGDLAVDQHDRGVLPAIARWDGTSGVRLNDSGVILSDADLITIPSGSSSGIAFGDGDTGVYESSDDVLVFKTNSTTAMSLSNVQVLSLANALPVTSGGTGVTSLTDGGILLGSGTSGVTATARPSNGELLIGSTGTDPVVASLTAGTGISITPGAGSISIASTASSTLEYLNKQSAASSASIQWTNTYLTNTYSHYYIVIRNCAPATDGAVLWMRVSDDNGSTWKSGASDYTWAGTRASTSTTIQEGDAADNEIQLMGTLAQGNLAVEEADLEIDLFNPLSATVYTSVIVKASGYTISTGLCHTTMSGAYITAAATNAIQFLYSSGNIATGEFIIYGVKES
jgi:hypothetical protein